MPDAKSKARKILDFRLRKSLKSPFKFWRYLLLNLQRKIILGTDYKSFCFSDVAIVNDD